MTFRVDAYPTDDFAGTVAQIRLQPVGSERDTYGTVIDVLNAQLKLKPGMTANVKIEIAKKTDVLRIPNTALRFRPTSEMFAALNQAVPPEVQFAGRGSRGSGGAARSSGSGREAPAAMPSEGLPSPNEASASARGGGGAPPQTEKMMERFKSMTADEQKQFIARMKDRGVDTTAFEKAAPAKDAKGAGKAKPAPAETIDALFAPLPPVETRGRVWQFVEHQLKSLNLRLGITDGSNTELLSGDVAQNAEVVTGVTGVGTTRTTATGGTGNPLLPGGRGPGGFGGAGGRGGR